MSLTVHFAVIRPWPRAVVRHCDPAGAYAERFWTPILGPGSMALQRSVLRQAVEMPSGIVWDHDDQAQRIGVRGGTLSRLVDRLRGFHMIEADEWDDGASLIFHDRWPTLGTGQLRTIERLSPSLRRQHKPYDLAMGKAG